jgi:hypothetical protein
VLPLLLTGGTTMKVRWIVSWHRLEEECSSAAEALDRWDQLEARGIDAGMFAVVAGHRPRIA